MEATTLAYPTRLSNTQWATLAAYFAADSQLGASQHQLASRGRGHSVCPACWLPLAHAAVGVSALADCVWLLPTLARPGQLEAHSPLPARLGCGSGASAPSRPGWPSPTRSRCH